MRKVQWPVAVVRNFPQKIKTKEIEDGRCKETRC